MLNERCKRLGIDFDGFAGIGYNCFDAKNDVFEAKQKNLYGLKSLGRKWKLTLVAEKLGLNTENAHDACADVRMLKEIFFILHTKK